MFYQPTLLGGERPGFDEAFAGVVRRWLDDSTWVEFASHWLAGADAVMETLLNQLTFRQRTDVRMYDRLVDEPRLTAWWRADDLHAELMPVLGRMREVLSERYGEHFDSIGFNLYRDGDDSVAWHGDRHRHRVVNPVIAIVSVGGPRPLRLRPRGGGASVGWSLGHGDLFVMGGACQHYWEHCVPKVAHTVPPRLSITFRSS